MTKIMTHAFKLSEFIPFSPVDPFMYTSVVTEYLQETKKINIYQK